MYSIARFGPCALGAILAAAVLASCSGGSPGFAPAGVAPSGRQTGLTPLSRLQDAALTTPHFRAPVVRTDRGASWMHPNAKKSQLLYVGDWGTNDVDVFDYPSGTRAGTLTGFDEPYGMCVDGKGDVFISNFGSGTVVEYAHGGTKPINTYSPGGTPIGCSIDTKGDVAATSFDPGEVTVYPAGKTTGSNTYSDPDCAYQWTMGYDNKGDLIGVGEADSVNVCALLAGSKSEIVLTESGFTVAFGGGTAWDGKYIALADQGDSGTGIVEARLSGTTLTQAGLVTLTDDCYGDYVDVPNTFFFGKSNITGASKKQAAAVLGPNLWCENANAPVVDVWKYPAGGGPMRRITSGLEEPYGAALSIAR